jgi:serine/threonine-protein kinase
MDDATNTGPLDCPSRDTLRKFHAGRLGEDELRQIGDHIAGCTACESVLDEIAGSSSDSLGRLLQGSLRAQAASTLTEPAYRAMENMVRALGTHFSLGPPGTVDEIPSPEELETPLNITIGPYHVLGTLGRGGMGVVYQARHSKIAQVVAIKMIRVDAQHRADLLARFRVEAQAVARLQHPNIVRLYSYDEYQDQPYFVMELVRGGNLSRKLKEGPFDFRLAAKLVHSLALAIEYAHAQGVIHRDLKPGNILLSATEGSEDLVPKIVDFGLAKLLDEEAEGWTSADGVIGTPSYMAPEQAEGRPRDVDKRTDVYSLGAILYELFTGKPPYLGKTKLETLRLVLDRQLVPPSRLRPSLPPDLEAVCLKCLEREADKRYSTAAELAAELDRWLKGEPTLVRPPTRLGRLKHTLRKRARLLLMLLAAIVAITAITGAVLTWNRDPEVDRGSRTNRYEAMRLESELRRGHAITLIGDTGKPKWYRWQKDPSKGHVTVNKDGTFSVTHPKVGLLELVPDPAVERYLLRAQVKHDKNAAGSVSKATGVGLYVSHTRHPGREEVWHSSVNVQFNAVWGGTRYLSSPEAKNRVRIITRLNKYEGTARDLTNEVDGPKVPLLGEENNQWFQLEVAVGPEGLTLTRFHAVGEEAAESPVKVTATEIDTKFQSLTDSLAQAPIEGPAPSFIPRSSLGIVVAYGTASFRDVVLTPLEKGPSTPKELLEQAR